MKPGQEWEHEMFLKYGKMFKLYGSDLGVWEELVKDIKSLLTLTRQQTREEMRELDKDERSLLLFFEDMAVNKWGWIDDLRKMNNVDFEIAEKWNKEGFVFFKGASRERSGDIKQLTCVVKLSDEAWEIASRLRKERALRHIPEPLQNNQSLLSDKEK